MYREHAPSGRLGELVECFWTMRSDGALPREMTARVLPDGCMDILFELDAAGQPRSYVVGAMRTPITVRRSGRVDMVAVRFRPGGASAFTGVPADELTDRTVPLAELWRGAAGEAEERLLAAAPADRPRVLHDLLAARSPAVRDARVAHVSRAIDCAGGAVQVQALPHALGITRRQLERIYAEHVGLTPKMACRVARVQSAMERIRRNPRSAGSTLALDCGWYDQPHMIRDFRRIAETTPAAYARQVANFQDRAAVAG